MPWLTPDTLGGGAVTCRPLFIPDDERFIEAVTGALYDLAIESNWELFGTVTPGQAAAAALAMLEAYDTTSCCEGAPAVPIGMMFPYVTADPPAGAIKCDGTIYADTDYPALWAIINPAWKTDSTHWRSPDLQNRFPAGAGGNDDPGAQGGSETIQIAHNQLPAGTGFLDSAPSGGVLSGLRYLVSSPANVSGRYFISGYGQPITVLPPYETYDWALQVE